jgi:hypothetical protein
LLDVTNGVEQVGMLMPALPIADLIGKAAWRNDRSRGLLERLPSRYTEPRKATPAREWRMRPELVGVTLGMRIERRNRQSYGQKMMRIRRVDAANGGPVTVKSAALHYLVSGPLLGVPALRATGRALERRRERLEALEPELAELRRMHADDPAKLLRETNKLYNENKANPLTTLALGVGVPIAAHIACIVVLPKHQSLPDLAAGVAFATRTGSSPLER